MKYLILLVGVIFMGACTIHHGTLSNSAIPQASFQKVGSAMGEAHAARVLIFGLSRQRNLVHSARTAMYRDYPLQNGQYYANISTDHEHRYFGLWTETNVYVHADIIGIPEKQLDSSDNSTPSKTEIVETQKKSEVVFNRGESVWYYLNGSVTSCTVLSELDQNRLSVNMNKNGREVNKYYPKADIFKTKNFPKHWFTPIPVGDNQSVLLPTSGKTEATTIKILGYQENRMLVKKIANGSYFIIETESVVAKP